MELNKVTTGLLGLGSMCIRFALAHAKWGPVLATRIEVSTPVTSILRVAEGLHLMKLGLSPYAGSALHAPPLLLLPLEHFSDIRRISTIIPFVLADTVCAILLYITAHIYVRHSEGTNVEAKPGVGRTDAAEAPREPSSIPSICALTYLLNPYTIMACVGASWSSFEACAVLLALCGAASRNPPLAAFGVAAAAYLSLFPVLLAVPVAIALCNGLDREPRPQDSKPAGFRRVRRWAVLAVFSINVMLWLTFLHLLSNVALRGFEAPQAWISEVYIFLLTVPDLIPNIGLYWYLFIELFDFFRPLFLAAFLSQPLIALAPLCIRLYHRPLFVAVVVVMLVAIFKPYPSVADIALYLSLLPMFAQQLARMRLGVLAVTGFVASSVLGPVFWYLWIITGVANSNFYYATTLVLAVAQAVLLIDVLSATIKFDHKSTSSETRKGHKASQ